MADVGCRWRPEFLGLLALTNDGYRRSPLVFLRTGCVLAKIDSSRGADGAHRNFEAENEDALRKVGMSKERRVDPQIQVGLLVDPTGFPLELHCFQGNTAETRTADIEINGVIQTYPAALNPGQAEILNDLTTPESRHQAE